MERIIEMHRNFHLWHYTASYSQLLLRSVDVTRYDTRIDVLFSNVELIHLEPDMERLSIDRLTLAEARELLPDSHDPNHGSVFLVNDGQGYVHASHCRWHEDEGGPHSPSRFGPLRGTE
ncbi:hypothetical protein IHE55_18765 [Streptomyces pactum]|uniref:Uncharacterized protein n=1 Tax=Streptomyces pactum TaxID=68249 RepID=A0ABS0NNB9_9ACTN|nr:hypothetical protein [Streptomyces pactum]MBH5336702.1 hypothetical protein [Streptomyces pactum]